MGSHGGCRRRKIGFESGERGDSNEALGLRVRRSGAGPKAG